MMLDPPTGARAIAKDPDSSAVGDQRPNAAKIYCSDPGDAVRRMRIDSR